MRGLRVLGIMMLAVLAVSIAGCATLTKSFKPDPTVVTLAAKVASVEATTGGQSLAPYRPAGIPLWPGSVVLSSAQAQTPQGKSWTASFTTPDLFEDVVKGFAVGLKDVGWTAEVADATVGEEQTSLLSASRQAADALVTVTRSADTSVTSIDVVVTPK